MEITDELVVTEGSAVKGLGLLTADPDGVFMLTPPSPSEEPSRAGIPVLSPKTDLAPYGPWVRVGGVITRGALVVDSIENIDRPDFPGPATARIPGARGDGWTDDEIRTFVADPGGRELMSGFGRDKDDLGVVRVAVHYVYLTADSLDQLKRSSVGDIDVWAALTPKV